MRIGIYNRWIHTMGGGESDMGSFAQVLQADHDVEFLAHEPLDLAIFASRLNVQIPRVSMRVLPFDTEYCAVIAASRDYDLFINTSHLDLFVPQAPRSMLRVFFPARPEYALPPPLATHNRWFERWFAPSQLRLVSGFYPPEASDVRPFAWTSHRAELHVRRQSRLPARELQVLLHSGSPPDVPPADVRLSINGTVFATRELPRTGVWIDWRIPLPPNIAAEPLLRVRLDTTTFNPRELGLSGDSRELGVGIGAVRLLDGRFSSRIAERLQTGVPNASAYAGVAAHRLQALAQTYDEVLAISRFTQQWIERRWHVSSSIIYPPVATTQFHAGIKRPMIVSVGRFFAGSHNKKHGAMIEAFRALCHAGLHDWEYHLIGGCDEAIPEHCEYLAEVRAAAVGYPIVLHVNAPFAEMQQIYSEATIFWHATGYGEDENQDPDSFEHFGITTVEAMAAGCVPVVIAKAGQLETVQANQSGLHWHTLNELQAQTQRLITDPALCRRLAAGALRRSRDFDYAAFEQQVRAVVEQ